MALPEHYTYGFVNARFIHGVADTKGDEDRKPEAMPAKGRVRFIPVAPSDTTPDTFITQKTHEAPLDEQGWISDGNGPGIWLTTGHWNVEIDVEGYSGAKSFPIEVLATDTEENPQYLPSRRPYEPNPTVKFVFSEQVYLDTLAARDQAVAAAEGAGAPSPEVLAQAIADYFAANPVPPPDLSGYVKTEDLPAPPDLSGYVKTEDLPAPPDLSGYVTSETVRSIVTLTQAQYDALVPEGDALYALTEE